jgi:hypothetical protein
MSTLLPEEGILTLDDACWHILEGWHLRTNAAERLADYHRLFLALLCRELGIEWHDDGAELRKAWESGSFRMPGFLPSLPERFTRLSAPDGGYLEYTPVRGETEVGTRHLPALLQATHALKKAWTAYLRDLLLLRWPEAATRTTTMSRLHGLGLGEPPNEGSYF